MSDTFWYQTGRILCGSRVSRILDHSCKTVLGGRTQIRDYQERGAFHSIYPTIDDVLYHPPQPAKSLDLLDERDQGITERTPRASPIIVLVVSLVIPYCLITILLQNKIDIHQRHGSSLPRTKTTNNCSFMTFSRNADQKQARLEIGDHK